MSRKTTILGLAAAAVLAGSAMTASAAPVVTLGLNLYEADGTTPIVADGGGVYRLVPGQIFNVVLTMNVTQPNLASSLRSNASVKNKPLGVSNLSVQLVTGAPLSSGLGDPATAGIIVPVIDIPGSPPAQELGTSYLPLIGTAGVNFPGTVNLGDVGGDGDRDTNGTGYGINPSVPTAANVGTTYAVGINGPVELISHTYIANAGSGIVNLHTNVTTLNVFADNANGTGNLVSNAIQSTDTGTNLGFGNWSEASVLIAVPEPASLGLLATGALALVARRRRA